MKRLWRGVVCAVMLAGLAAGGAHAGTQDFTVDSFKANYTIFRNSDGVAELRVREGIVVDIPAANQNHGILRALPQSYQGHSVELAVEAVVDGSAKPWPYETSSQNGNLVLKIGDANNYLNVGKHEFIIDYSMRGVTLNLADHQEFYWDVNGDQWAQPFKQVAATVTVDQSIAGDVQGNLACYTGVAGSTETNCTTGASGNVYTFTATRQLGAGENLTIVMGFNKGTFADYKPSTTEQLRMAGLFMSSSS